MTAVSQKALLFAFSALALLPGGRADAQPLVVRESALSRQHAVDILVEAVGFRLATANTALCLATGRDPGFSIHTLEQYQSDYRIEAALAFGLNRWPTVMSVAPASPAALAGLREGDALSAVNGLPLPETGRTSAAADFARTEAAQRTIDAAFAHGAAILTVIRAGQQIEIPMKAVPACRSLFKIVPEATPNVAFDSHYVQVSSTLVALTQNPDELAAVLARELAHTILRHRERLEAQHVTRNWLTPFGRNARLIRETEIEADRLSLYLVARAGYSVPVAISFWARIAKASGGVELDPNRPQWHERLAALQREAGRITADAPAKLLPPPDLMVVVAGR